ncbi:hypothetical protein D918_06266 [Trichuris suis]|nr:hypothetical protein D918_06266 [Trichuris suis]
MRHQGGNIHCPKMHGYRIGDDKIEYIIMDLLGQSLNIIQKSHDYAPIDAGKAANIGFQCVEALKSLHGTGFIHRDVKPGNIALGLNDDRNFIYIIDLGLARRIRYKDGSLLPPRSSVGFCGTPHYASIRALANEDQSMADDLVSLFYMLCELVSGKLPWAKNLSRKEIIRYKESSFRQGTIAPPGAQWLKRFGEHVLSLKYTDKPRYGKLQRLCIRKMQEEVAKGFDVLTLNPMFENDDLLASSEQFHLDDTIDETVRGENDLLPAECK